MCKNEIEMLTVQYENQQSVFDMNETEKKYQEDRFNNQTQNWNKSSMKKKKMFSEMKELKKQYDKQILDNN